MTAVSLREDHKKVKGLIEEFEQADDAKANRVWEKGSPHGTSKSGGHSDRYAS